MKMPSGQGESNPGTSWLGSRGMWVTYAVFLLLLHLFLLSVPFLTIPMAWTLTNVIHNVCNYFFLHSLKGAPWEIQDCPGDARNLTHWEQIDYGVQFTTTRKFLTVVPVLLFCLASFYTRYNSYHFVVNFLAMLCVVIPKLPFSIVPFSNNNRKNEHS